jgi:hypothetical protein
LPSNTALQSDRFAPEIIGILTHFAERLRRLNGIPFGRSPDYSLIDRMEE